MRTFGSALFLAFIFLGSAPAKNDRRGEAEALFARANDLIGVEKPDDRPYTINGHFRVVINQPVDGTFRKAVLRENVARTEISFPGYTEVVVRNGDTKWVRRNAAFTPERVRELMAALQPRLKVLEKEKVEKITDEVVGTTRAQCVKLKFGYDWRSEVCIDAVTGTVLRTKISQVQKEIDYEAFSSAGSKQFPMKIRMTEAGNAVAEFWLDSVSVDAPDKSLFDPLQNAAVWPTCDKPKPPVPVSTPDPNYTDVDIRNHVQGIVALQLVVDEHGKTQDPTVTRSLTPGLDGEAKKTVLGWRFQPATCGSKPIPVEMDVQVSFKLRN